MKIKEIKIKNFCLLFLTVFVTVFASIDKAKATVNTWENVGIPQFSAGTASRMALSFSPLSNEPYVAYNDNSDSGKATVMKYNGSSWVNVGDPGFSSGIVWHSSLDFSVSGVPYIAIKENNKATVMKYNGSSWVNVGDPGFSSLPAGCTSLAINPITNDPYIAYIGFDEMDYSNKAYVMKFNGVSWEYVGNPGFSSNSISELSMEFKPGTEEPYVSFVDESNSGKPRVMKYSGGSWQNVGTPGFTFGQINRPTLAFNPSTKEPYVTYEDYRYSSKATVMKLEDDYWQIVGSPGFSAGTAYYTSIAFNNFNEPYVAYMDYGNSHKATVMKYNGSSWVNVGIAGFSSGNAPYTTLAFNPLTSEPHVAFADGSDPGRITVMKFTYDTVATPTASPSEGSYSSNQLVALSTTTSGATIYYTTNGSTPTTSSDVYSSAITISNNTTLKAIAVKSGMIDSDVLSEVYNIQVATPTASPEGGNYTSNQSVTLSTATSGATIYYTTDGSTPTVSSAIYSSPLLLSNTTTLLKAFAVKSGMLDSNVKTERYTINLQTVATPTASPAGGTYASDQTVTLGTGTAGATIHYTTDGSDPNSSSAVYSSPLSISNTTTLKAIAIKSGMLNSSVMSETYTIKVTTTTPTLTYSISKKAKTRISYTFKNLSLTNKKYVTMRIGNKKVKVTGVRRSGSDSIVTVELKYAKWGRGSYGLAMSYKNQTKVAYKTKKGKTKYKKGWERGSVSQENVLTIQ